MVGHIKTIDLTTAPNSLVLKYEFRGATDFFGIEKQTYEFTLGEVRAACWKEIADVGEIKPEDVYMIEAALRERYPSYTPSKITELLRKLQRL